MAQRRRKKTVARGNSWPFDQPPNCAVITLLQIVEGREPILHVSHNSDDHGWQFLCWEDARVEDGVVVCFAHILERDPSIRELADLPPGWHAWRRSAQKPWKREPNPYDRA
jgi:hypothetical protein